LDKFTHGYITSRVEVEKTQIWEDLPKKISAENKDEDYFRKKSR